MVTEEVLDQTRRRKKKIETLTRDHFYLRDFDALVDHWVLIQSVET